MTSWGNRAAVGDSLVLSGQVAMLAREIGISTPDVGHDNPSWEEWVEQEERRRTLWVAYVQFNLQCIAFNVPPMILNQEVLCGEEWKVRNSQDWMRMRSFHTPDSRNFQQVLGQLLQGRQIHKSNAISAFANYVLIHGLFQEIFFARNTASLVEPTGSLQVGFVQTMESALRAWQNSWEATYESTLDPLSPRGPMGFNATALVRLAYIRLNANTGPYRQLSSRDPQGIAHELLDGRFAVYERSPFLDRAVLQCIHALSIPDIARCIETSSAQTLRDDERKLLNMVYHIFREADLTELSFWADDNADAVRHLAACTARLWADIFQGFHTYEVSRVVAEGLAIIADTLDAPLETHI
ncbi:hypothetical protein N7532_003910 [Penicillium argentinense]|uniref:Transcription factor domain-containing protein n=1 Tax=Penicillium argentinense TaxID=1131581 RepID=A0A9W9KEZ1_9EURO|nr:uncharacterized protein N7532_003910 [Penicillium argentinense]KAJ5103381.1 hypothetical protein N7532_003910 [Penicillium argentinense]